MLISDSALMVWQGRSPRDLRWSEVAGVTWLDRHRAAVDLRDGGQVELPALPQLVEAVTAIEQRAAAHAAGALPVAARTDAVVADEPDVVREVFHRHRLGLAWRDIRIVLTIAFLVTFLPYMIFVAPSSAGTPPIVLLLLSVMLILVVWIAVDDLLGINARGIRLGRKRRPWREILSVDDVVAHRSGRGGTCYSVHLRTSSGLVTFVTRYHVDVDLIQECVQRLHA